MTIRITQDMIQTALNHAAVVVFSGGGTFSNVRGNKTSVTVPLGNGTRVSASAGVPVKRGRKAAKTAKTATKARKAAPKRAAKKTTSAKRDPHLIDDLTSRLATAIEANPGLRIEKLAAVLKATTRELSLPVKRLIKSKTVTTKGQKRATVYLPARAKTTVNGAAAHATA